MIALIAVAAILGLATSGYLLWKHYGPSRGPLICPFGQSCDFVLDSRYGRLLGFRNEILGVTYYLALLALLGFTGSGRTLLLAVLGTADPLDLAFYLSMPVALASIVLTGIQALVLKNWCSYCLFTNAINIAIFFALGYAR